MSREHNIEQEKCNCQGPDIAEITRVVESVVERIGREKNKVIPILQAVQNELNWIPSDALRHISKITEITPGQISGVSTFYSQFRHIPAGDHTIKICKGTASHVKGASLVIDAFKRELKLKEGSSTTDDGRFSIEEVACLGCCTLAPVVRIEDKTYGHVKTSSALSSPSSDPKITLLLTTTGGASIEVSTSYFHKILPSEETACNIPSLLPKYTIPLLKTGEETVRLPVLTLQSNPGFTASSLRWLHE
ncbi:hypothetical protein ES705_40849 [subsurface metagenome]